MSLSKILAAFKSRKGVQSLGLGDYINKLLEDIISLKSLCGKVLAGLNTTTSMEEASYLLMKLHYGCHLPDIVPLVEAFIPTDS